MPVAESDMCSVCGECEVVLIHDDHYFCETCINEMREDPVIICPICEEDITALVNEEESTDNEDERWEDSSDEETD